MDSMIFNQWSIRVSLSLLLTLAFAQTSWGTIENLKSFKKTYFDKSNTTYTCKTCHKSAVGKKGDLNAYGLALQKLKAPADAKKLTEADFREIEKEDADQDGASNLDEINAGTNPGDPLSLP